MSDNENDFRKGILAYMQKPKPSYGNVDENPANWLKAFTRMKKATSLGDVQMLLVVSGYLKGAAEMWWESVEDETATWEDFVAKFKAKFASELIRQMWWAVLESLRQGPWKHTTNRIK